MINIFLIALKHSGLRYCLNNCNCNLSKIEHLSNIDHKFQRKYLKAKIKDEFQVDIVSVHEGKKLSNCDIWEISLST